MGGGGIWGDLFVVFLLLWSGLMGVSFKGVSIGCHGEALYESRVGCVLCVQVMVEVDAG